MEEVFSGNVDVFFCFGLTAILFNNHDLFSPDLIANKLSWAISFRIVYFNPCNCFAGNF